MTISDVARHAGVSATTVSRVINGELNVGDDKRRAVQAAVAALGFSPNLAARRLAGAGQWRVGMLYANPSAAYLSEFLVGSLEGARRSGIQLSVEQCQLGAGAIAVARRMIDHGIDGLILTPPLDEVPGLVEAIREGDIALVVVGSGRPAAEFPAIGIDDRAAALTMTRHLVAQGHRRIGFVMGRADVSVAHDRLHGYREALADAGIATDAALVADGDYTYRSGLAAAEQLLDLPDRPSAIFASNDDMAAAVVAVAHRRGLDVPGDLTVCGFDDTTLATVIWPALTTIRQPIADMAREGVGMLAEALRRRRAGDLAAPEHRTLAFTLIRRESDAAPGVAGGRGARRS